MYYDRMPNDGLSYRGMSRSRRMDLPISRNRTRAIILCFLCFPVWFTATAEEAGFVLDARVTLAPSDTLDLSVQTLLADLDHRGVRLALASAMAGGADGAREASPEDLLSAVMSHPERLRAFLRARPGEDDLERLEGLVDQRLPGGDRIFVALEFHPEKDGFAVDETGVEAYLELCARNFRPAVFHSGAPGSKADPGKILALARRHPKVSMVLFPSDAEGAFDAALGAAKAARMAEDAKLYLGTGALAPEEVRRAVRELGADRVVYGGGAASRDELDHLLRKQEAAWSDLEQARVLGGNAAWLFDVTTFFDGPSATGSMVWKTERYAFHSQFWINLHHFLYQWAYAEAESKDWRVPKNLVERGKLPSWSAAEEAAWREALGFYGEQMVGQSLNFDYVLGLLKRRLTTLDEASAVHFADVPLTIHATLASAAPVYRKYWWPQHDRRNRQRVQELQPRLEKLEEAFAHRLARAYGGEWPKDRVRVDLVAYSNWAGAYTSSHPFTHIVMSSTNEGYQGDPGFEMVLHETSHSGSLIRPVRRGLSRAFEEQGSRPPRDLWHVILFWTSGAIAERLLAEEGVEGYRAYAEANDLYTGPWESLRQAIEGVWNAEPKSEEEALEAYRKIAVRWLASQKVEP